MTASHVPFGTTTFCFQNIAKLDILQVDLLKILECLGAWFQS